VNCRQSLMGYGGEAYAISCGSGSIRYTSAGGRYPCSGQPRIRRAAILLTESLRLAREHLIPVRNLGSTIGHTARMWTS